MSYSLPKSFHCCLTCVYWCGFRRLIMMESMAETNDSGTKGECVNQDGFYHLETQAQSSCGHYEPLPALRD
ncbi:MAG: hypothetical protein J6N45_07800 [Alphaproteobacteria bacterium]|nr:hypothetical protein [Alphaproteobacteria bacterium]